MIVVALSAGACGSAETSGGSTAAPPPSAAPSSAAAAAGVGKAETCRAVDKAKADFGKTVAGTITAGADGTAEYKKGLTDLGTQLEAAAGQTGDAALAATLKDVAAGSRALAASADPLEADGAAFEKAGEKLEALCKNSAAPASASPGGAGGGTAVGAAGSGCELPVTFELPKGFQPKAVAVPKDAALAELVRKGPLTVACEISAEGAGQVGFLRVWVDAEAKGNPRQSLQALLAGEDVRKPAYKQLTVGGRPGAEVTYDKVSALTEETRTERAFAVQTARGMVAVTVGGLDAGEQEMVSAYELARRSLTIRS